MAAIFPTIPRVVFTIIEPLFLLAGAIAPIVDPSGFVSSQLASEPMHPLFSSEHVLALQLGNTYFLIGLIGLFVLYTTSEAKVARGYIIAALIADITHVGGTAYMMGKDDVLNVRAWNAMAFGNIGVTAALFLIRCLYLMGLLGEDQVHAKTAKRS